MRLVVVQWFWPIWLTLTVFLLGATGMLLHGANRLAVRQAGTKRVGQEWSSSIGPLLLLLLLVSCYMFFLVAGDDVNAYDDSQLTRFSLRGIDLPVRIWPESGRFFPLAMQKFNLVARCSRSVAAYHTIAIVEMLLASAALFLLQHDLGVCKRMAITAAALISPSVALSFSVLVYTEGDVILGLSWMSLCMELFRRTRSRWAALGAVCSAQLALYHKEPVFLFVLSLAVIRILLRSRACGSLRQAWRDADTRLDIALAGVAFCFCIYFAVSILPRTDLQYLIDTRLPIPLAVRAYMGSDWAVWVFSLLVTGRMWRIFRGSASPDLLWDGLACGAMAYFAGYLVMGMVSPYYLAPADIFATLYLGRHLCLSWSSLTGSRRVGAAALASLLMVQSVDLLTIQTIERKSVLRRKTLVADLILSATSGKSGRVTRLYFPFTAPYGISELAAYLSYRGLPLEEAGAGISSGATVGLAGAKIRQSGKCVPISSFVCHEGPSLDGDLTVVLPDDAYTQEDIPVYRDYEQKLLAIDPTAQSRGRLLRLSDLVWKYATFVRRLLHF